MTLHTICLNDVAPQPWKNGGGETRELLAWPQKDSWTLRLSVADITKDGPFSELKGIRRWIAVLEGSGMHLGPPFDQRVVPDTQPFSFDGQYPAPCELLAGPTRDLNLMIRTHHGDGEMCALLNGPYAKTFTPLHAFDCAKSPDIVGIFCDSAIEIRTLDAHRGAPPYSLIWSDDDTRNWHALVSGRAWTFQCTLNATDTPHL